MADTPSRLRACSFCARTEKEVLLLIPSNNGRSYICENCIDMFSGFISEHFDEELDPKKVSSASGKLDMKTLPKPQEIKAMLDTYVIGQDEAKLALSVSVYNHYKRILTLDKKNTKKSAKAEASTEPDEFEDV